MSGDRNWDVMKGDRSLVGFRACGPEDAAIKGAILHGRCWIGLDGLWWRVWKNGTATGPITAQQRENALVLSEQKLS